MGNLSCFLNLLKCFSVQLFFSFLFSKSPPSPWQVSKDEVAILAREESEAQELAAAHERACALALAKGQEPPPLWQQP